MQKKQCTPLCYTVRLLCGAMDGAESIMVQTQCFLIMGWTCIQLQIPTTEDVGQLYTARRERKDIRKTEIKCWHYWKNIKLFRKLVVVIKELRMAEVRVTNTTFESPAEQTFWTRVERLTLRTDTAALVVFRSEWVLKWAHLFRHAGRKAEQNLF